MRQAALILGLALVAGSVQGQSIQVAGYAKSLAISSRLPDDGESFFLILNRLRAEGQASLNRRVRLEAWLDSEILTGSLLRTDDYQETRLDSSYQLLDLDWTMVQSTSVEIRQRLFRAFATVESGPVVWTLGRQRIAWGTGFAWNPTDLLNPFNPGAIELSERGGVDAVHASISLGSLSRAEIVAVAAERAADFRYAARGGTNVGQYDVSLMAGLFGRRKALGGDFAGYIGGAGVRGEFAWVHPNASSSYMRAVVNADYTFRPGIYALTEVYFNGRQSAEQGEVFGQGRWYGAFTMAAPLTPLIAVSAYGLVNISDGSALCGPAVTVSLSQELELQAAAYMFAGPTDSEFGRQQHAVFAALQWYY